MAELTNNQKAAIKKLDKEMERAKDPCSRYIAEQLLQLATSCLEVAEKILEKKKTLDGALAAVKDEARKQAVAGCVCVDEAQTMAIAYKYYDIDEQASAQLPAGDSQALGKTPAKPAEKQEETSSTSDAVSVNLDDFF